MRPRGAAGLSLVELLVVLGIIGLISAVLVPVAVRSGWFTSSQSATGARELFTLLKAASVYAGTYNVDAALAYGGRLVVDSESGEQVPIADTLILARRLKREEINALRDSGHALASTTDEYYVPVRGPEGVFRPMPNDSCVLPDLFEVVDVGTGTPRYTSNRGLRGILLYDPTEGAFVEPRFDSDLDQFLDYVDDLAYDPGNPMQPASFPAHVFKPDGSIRVASDFPRQRFHVRAGILPDQTPGERFYTDPQGPPLDPRPIPIVFHEFDGSNPPVTDLFFTTDPADDPDPDDGLDPLADIDITIEMFPATGRVRIVE